MGGNGNYKILRIPYAPCGKVFYEKDGELIEDELFSLSVFFDGSKIYTTKDNIILLSVNFGKTWFSNKEEALLHIGGI